VPKFEKIFADFLKICFNDFKLKMNLLSFSKGKNTQKVSFEVLKRQLIKIIGKEIG